MVLGCHAINPTGRHKMGNSAEWEIEGEIMTLYPEFAVITPTAKAAIISDILARYVTNQPLWEGLQPFVRNYLSTINAWQVGFSHLPREVLENWGNLLSMLNVG